MVLTRRIWLKVIGVAVISPSSTGTIFVLRDDFNGQEPWVLIVVRGDLDAYGSDGTFGLRFDSRTVNWNSPFDVIIAAEFA